jgi:CBS domain-containing protein
VTGAITAAGVKVGTIARPAITLAESLSIGSAWERLQDDPERCGVVLRGRTPIAVVTAGDLAERWPAGGPLVAQGRPLASVLDRPLGVEVLDAGEPAEHAARRLLAIGLPALPVAATEGRRPLGVVTSRLLLAALLELPTPAPDRGP